MMDNSAQIFFQSFLQEAVVSSSGMVRDAHSLTLFIQHSSADCGISNPPSFLKGLEKLLWCVTCTNHASFHLLTFARRGSCRPQGSCSFSAPSCWHCALSRRCRGVSSGTWFQQPESFSQINKQGPCLTAIEEDGGDQRLVHLELACKANGVAFPYPV